MTHPAGLFTCTRVLAFDAAHRLRNHEGKCSKLHGHRYVVEAHFAAQTLDAVGRVIDFGVIKARLGGWLDTHWDHNTLLEDSDTALIAAIQAAIPDQEVYILPVPPSAEHLAWYLLMTVCPMLFADTGLSCTSITVHETPNCSVAATCTTSEEGT